MENAKGKRIFVKGTVKRKETKQDAKGKKGVNYGKKLRRKKRFMDLLIMGIMKTSSVLVQQNKDRREPQKLKSDQAEQQWAKTIMTNNL